MPLRRFLPKCLFGHRAQDAIGAARTDVPPSARGSLRRHDRAELGRAAAADRETIEAGKGRGRNRAR